MFNLQLRQHLRHVMKKYKKKIRTKYPPPTTTKRGKLKTDRKSIFEVILAEDVAHQKGQLSPGSDGNLSSSSDSPRPLGHFIRSQGVLVREVTVNPVQGQQSRPGMDMHTYVMVFDDPKNSSPKQKSPQPKSSQPNPQQQKSPEPKPQPTHPDEVQGPPLIVPTEPWWKRSPAPSGPGKWFFPGIPFLSCSIFSFLLLFYLLIPRTAISFRTFSLSLSLFARFPHLFCSSLNMNNYLPLIRRWRTDTNPSLDHYISLLLHVSLEFSLLITINNITTVFWTFVYISFSSLFCNTMH